jgi:hypothetical protein
METMFQEVLGRETDMAQMNLIHPEASGYRVFDRYRLQEHNNEIAVDRDGEPTRQFTCTRSALSWCIADKYQQRATAQEIHDLDQRRRQLRDDIDMSRQLLERTQQHHNREVIEAKMQYKRQMLRDADARLDKCVALAKYWQIRGFNDEIARTRRPAPNSTNRPGHRKPARSSV